MPATVNPEIGIKPDIKLDTPWNVIIHNDPVNLMSYVALVIRRIFGYTDQEAEKLMMQVHQQGRSVVWSGPRERAEHYVRELHAHQLLATLQQTE